MILKQNYRLVQKIKEFLFFSVEINTLEINRNTQPKYIPILYIFY